jgi:hypothetical protein
MASRDLKLCVSELQEKAPLIIAEYNAQFPERVLKVICTLRSSQEQQALYALGRTTAPIGKKYIVTHVDGVKVFSKHNPDPQEPLAKAVDFGVFIGGKYIQIANMYYPLLELARKYDLISGIDFGNTGLPLEILIADKKKWKDLPHLETKTTYYKKEK